MTFTDDDLKRLKVHLETDKEFHQNATWVEHVQMDALISRLEAAEAVCQTVARRLLIDSSIDEIHAMEKWRKSAGK